tara:strand:- start:180 stop:350 length:171 start_codon:yes stop_codon:yes gene_type:complete
MTKEKMVEVFKAAGLSEVQMAEFHKQFEARYPEDHQAFLEWLNISTGEIVSIRKNS